MRFIGLVIVVAVGVGAAPAAAQRYPQRYPQDYVQPFTPLWARPQLYVDPPVGPPGSQVRIGGSRFHRGVQAYYGDMPMRIVAVRRNELIAEIPWDARGQNYIYVVDNTGRARTNVSFGVERRRGRYYSQPRPYYPPSSYRQPSPSYPPPSPYASPSYRY